MIAVIDYGAGNLGSVEKALRYIGAPAEVTRDADVLLRHDALILPGVGALGHCMEGLRRANLIEATRAFIASGRPFLGICIGMQMLFETSEEGGQTPGLGILPGRVRRFDVAGSVASDLKVPHMGWNALEHNGTCPILRGVPSGAMAYFVHSYYAEPADPGIVAATTHHGLPFCSAIRSANVFATQFHPEKSGAIGLMILRNFVGLVP